MSNLVNEPIILPDESSDNEDRLSDLPDCILLHILSFLNAIHVVQTCILSTRWKKNLWKHIPALILHSNKSPSSSGFSTLKSFDKFVSAFLSLRDHSIALHTFDFHRLGSIQSRNRILKNIASYLLSHSKRLQRLGISIKGDSCLILPCVSSCRALTSLKLSVYSRGLHESEEILFPKSLYLPALTSLDLTNFAFCADDNADHAEPFSAFNRLNSLIICSCAVRDAQILTISSATLDTLTIDGDNYFTKIELSAPSLCTLTFNGNPEQKLCGSSLYSVKRLNIDVYEFFTDWKPPLVLFSWLLDLPNITSLTVTTNALMVLSLVPDLLKVEFPSLCNLKSLIVKMQPFSWDATWLLLELGNKSRKEVSKIRKAFTAGMEPAATIRDKIVGFLCQNSPSAKVDFM